MLSIILQQEKLEAASKVVQHVRSLSVQFGLVTFASLGPPVLQKDMDNMVNGPGVEVSLVVVLTSGKTMRYQHFALRLHFWCTRHL